MKKRFLKICYLGLFMSIPLMAGPADSVADGPQIGGIVADVSQNTGTVTSIGGAKIANQEGEGLSKQSAQIGDVNGTETDVGNVEITGGKVTGSVVDIAKNKSTIVNVGTQVKEGSIKMTKGSAGAIINDADNKGAIVSVGGGEFNINTKDVENTTVKVGNTAGTVTEVGSIDNEGATVKNEISNAGMKNKGVTVNVGGVVKKGAIDLKSGKATSIDDSSHNSGTIVNIGGGSFTTSEAGGVAGMSLDIGSQQSTETDVGNVEMDSTSGTGTGAIYNYTKNSGTVVNVGTKVKEGSIQIGE